MCNAEEACRGLLRVYAVLSVGLLWLGRPRQPSRNALLCAVFGAVLLGEVMEDVPLYGGFVYFYPECGCKA